MIGKNRFQRFSLLVLAATVGVILWGAYVRVTGSGAGCGSHWPTCNGEVIPRPKSIATIIEFTHRATSGIAFLLVAVQMVWALRGFPRGHRVRRPAVVSMILMITEAIVGAGLVIFEMVAGNTSEARAGWMAAHLMNTFALLAALALTVWSAGEEEPAAPLSPSAPSSAVWRGPLLGGLAALVVVSMSGAIVALGDTLFPARSLAEGISQDFSPTAHLFVRLRVFHPILAVSAAIYLLVLGALIATRGATARLRGRATAAAALVVAQVIVGFLNLGLLAPATLQILHLLMADAVWLSMIILTATAIHEGQRAVAPVAAPISAARARG